MTTPRDAATLICLRPDPSGGYEVLLTKRPESMSFMGGAWVFPGGAYEESDPDLPSTLSPQEARSRIAEDVDPRMAAGLFACALRELWEETGILIAVDADGRHVPQPAIGPGVEAVLDANEWRLDTARLVWHGRAVTPPGVSPIRFDARYFAAAAPAGVQLRPDEREVADARWMRASDAILAGIRGEMRIPVPTMATLQGLSETPGLEQMLAPAVLRREVESEQLSPLVTRILAPNPGLATGPGTNTYVIGDGDTIVIDPAVPDPIFLERVVIEAARAGKLTGIVLTHMHPDHVSGAWLLAEQTGVPIMAWHAVAETMPSVVPLRDGDVRNVGGGAARVIHTPGHASAHISLLVEPEHAMLCGDVVAGMGTVVIPYPDGNLADYLATLRAMRDLDLSRLYPGHGPVITDVRGKLDEYIVHRAERERQVIEALQHGPQTAHNLVRRIYADVPEALWPMAELSVTAHLAKLADERVVVDEKAVWRLNATVELSHSPEVDHA